MLKYKKNEKEIENLILSLDTFKDLYLNHDYNNLNTSKKKIKKRDILPINV
jgi:hypothetical protein